MHSSKYYPQIDGLRAIAVLSVFLFHLRAAWLPGGFVGVDVFFVISGFVVSASVLQFRGNFIEFLSYFYSRRFARILPALFVCLFLSAIATLLFIPQAWLSRGIDRVLRAALIGFGNIALIKAKSDYFSPKSEYNPFTHTWSLGVEEQFYFLFPLLFYMWLVSKTAPWKSTLLFATVFIVSLSLALHNTDIAVDFYGTHTRLWEISLGVLTFMFTRVSYAPKIKDSRKANLIATLCLLSIGISLLITSEDVFPSFGTFLAILPTAILLYCISLGPDSTASILARPSIRRIGLISYSLYLYHWPVIVIMRWTWGLESYASIAFATLLSFTLAMASYKWIENPFRQAKIKWGAKNWQIITCGFIGMISVSSSSRWAFKNQDYFSLSSSVQKHELWDAERYDFKSTSCEAIKQADAADSRYFVIRRQGTTCQSDPTLPKIFVIGDSHAAAYEALFKKMSFELGYEIQMRSSPACALVSFYGPLDEQSLGCKEFLKTNISKVLQDADPGDILFLPGLRVHRLTNQLKSPSGAPLNPYQQMMTLEAIQKREHSLKTAQTELAPFIEKKMIVVFEAPKPIFKTPAYRCVDWFNKSNPDCKEGFEINQDVLTDYVAPVREGLQTLIAQNPTLKIWDPFPVLCPPTDNKCSMFMNNKPIFFDQDHLSGYGNDILFKDFTHFLQQLQKKTNYGKNI